MINRMSVEYMLMMSYLDKSKSTCSIETGIGSYNMLLGTSHSRNRTAFQYATRNLRIKVRNENSKIGGM